MPSYVPSGYFGVKPVSAETVRDDFLSWGYRTAMVTKRRKSRVPPPTPQVVYLDGRMRERGRGDQWVAEKMNVSRETVTRWRGDPNRLSPNEILKLAKLLDFDILDMFRSPADGPSLDAIVRDAKPELRETAVDIVRRLVEPKTPER